MTLSAQFNLHSKTQAELKGLYADIFNRLGCLNISQLERERLNAILNDINQELSSLITVGGCYVPVRYPISLM